MLLTDPFSTHTRLLDPKTSCHALDNQADMISGSRYCWNKCHSSSYQSPLKTRGYMAVSVKLEECGYYPIEFVLMRSVMKVLL
jgi:hypothetical protein